MPANGLSVQAHGSEFTVRGHADRPLAPGGGQHVVENAPTPPGGSEESASQPTQAVDGERLFGFLANQHRALADQVAANQAMSNQQMWDRVAQLLSSK